VLPDVGLEHLLLKVVGVFQRVKDMSLQGGVAGVGLEEAECLLALFHETRMAG
jgi:hypothetical protein